jgi:hypothetical protein
MKKFSSITGQKVGEEPKKEARTHNEEEVFRYKVMGLMEDLLSVRTYGPVDRYLRAGSIKIAGKEELLDALMSLMTEKSSKDQSKLLEGLKSEIKDWKAIDSKKAQLEESANSSILKERRKVASMLEKYGSDEGTLEMMASQAASKLEIESAEARALAAREMAFSDCANSKKLEKIAVAFEARVEALRS